MEWSADELGRFLVDCGFSPVLLGYTENNNVDPCQEYDPRYWWTRSDVASLLPRCSVAAVINVYNEEDVIGSVVRYLHSQGIAVHVVDNWSTDNTWNIVAALLRDCLCASALRYPEQPSSEYDWAGLLQHTAQYAAELGADWIIHYDADEFRSSPWCSSTLVEAISFVDSLGYSAIDFHRSKLCLYRHGSSCNLLTRSPALLRLRKAWRSSCASQSLEELRSACRSCLLSRTRCLISRHSRLSTKVS